MSAMHNPSHPGLILREDVLPELNLSVKDAAEQLGVSRVTLSRVINGHAAISADMALRLGQWVGNGPDIWLRMQVAFDLWQAKKAGAPKVKRAKPVSGQKQVAQLPSGS
jgi:antitoxin HigA-1